MVEALRLEVDVGRNSMRIGIKSGRKKRASVNLSRLNCLGCLHFLFIDET